MEEYRDLLITEDDLTPDAGGIPEMVTGRASIAQDIVHMIRESGLLTENVGELRPHEAEILPHKKSVSPVDDDDERIIPGTTEISESEPGVYWLTAQTELYGALSLALEA